MKNFLLLILLLGSCSYKKNNQILKGHEELYSEPNTPDLKSLDEGETRIVIASTNDIAGHYDPLVINFVDDNNKSEQNTHIGGQDVISDYFKILRHSFKNVILVDSGNLFSEGEGTLKSADFYNQLEYDALTFGLGDFNLRVPSKLKTTTELFKDFAKNSKAPVLLSNLYELKSARVVEWEGTASHLIKEVDDVKIGIIGLIPDDIVTQTPLNNRVGLYLEKAINSTLKRARLLRSLGAEIIVVITHQGIDCNSIIAEGKKLPRSKVNFKPRRKNICDLRSSLGQYLERLPHGLIDVVVGGRSHEKTANYVNDVMVISGYAHGKSFQYAEIVFDKKNSKINHKKSKIHQPVYFCHEFFKETMDCYPDDESIDHKNRVPAKFLGIPISPQTINLSKKTPAPQFTTVKEVLNRFNSQIAFIKTNSDNAQLVKFTFTGLELIKMLEEDFNQGNHNSWTPNPFQLMNDELRLSLENKSIQLDKIYHVLTDLSSAQSHWRLLKKITHSETISYSNDSWSSGVSDEVSLGLAGRSHD